MLRHPSLQFDDKQVENIKDPAADERENNCGADGKHLASSSKFNLLANNLNNSQGKLNDRSKSKKSKKLVDSPCEGGKGEAQVKKDANCHAHQFEPATTEFKVLKVNPPYEETAVQLEAASLAKDVHLDKPTTTPAKPKAPHETEPDPILRFQTESWACLSPPPNFELPQDFHKETGGLDAFITHSFGGCSILLPSNSLLEAGDKIGKPVGNSANVIRKGIEALFMQVKEDKGNPSTDEFQPTKSHAEHDLFNYGILKEGLTNSSWLLEFERNQSERQEKPKNNGRPFAALFGNDG